MTSVEIMPEDTLRCIHCGFYERKDNYWRRRQNGSFIGVCKRHNRKVADSFCGCEIMPDGNTRFWNFTEGSWEEN